MGKPQNERLIEKIFYSLRAAQIVIETHRRENNTRTLPLALGHRSPAAPILLVPPNLVSQPEALDSPTPLGT
jgi:hypothetical protein